ncbi:hypothetical protein F8M41_024002 [Gigaspora margarita]|uniref:Uncharacterized protein n=1 Tax=Gigaspora margarita TaxID=4874 RepID=A0A8H4ETD8_GIGMA|nr:hypothetical protein F8M41_024002 [Gigaspora margarita]
MDKKISTDTDNAKGIGTKDVKKKENKEVKVEMKLSITCPKLVKGDHTNEIRDLKDCQTRIGAEKDIEKDESMASKCYQKSAMNKSDTLALNDQEETYCCTDGCERIQDKILKVNDAKVLEHRRFRKKELASRDRRLTYLGNEQVRVELVNSDRTLEIILHKIFGWYLKHAESDDPDGQNNLNPRPTKGDCPGTKGLESLEAVDKSENNSIQPEDQFKRPIVRNVNIGVENDGSNSIILVSKMNNKEDKKIDSLPKSSQEVIQITECSDKCQSNSKVIIAEVGDVRENVSIDADKNNHLFDPGGSIFPKTKEAKFEFKLTHLHIQLPTSYDDIGDIYARTHKIKWGRLFTLAYWAPTVY